VGKKRKDRGAEGSRRKAREIALQSLYAMEFPDKTADQVMAEAWDWATEPESEDEDIAALVRAGGEALEFAERLVRGVTTHHAEIDELLASCSTNWRVSRMAMVDRNILRLATFELLYVGEVPPRVTLNEAIEIAKRYGTADSGAFINGILDRVASTVASRSRE